MGVLYQKYAQYAADQLGCEIMFAEASVNDTRTSAQQNMIEMGCQGLIMTTCAEFILQRNIYRRETTWKAGIVKTWRIALPASEFRCRNALTLSMFYKQVALADSGGCGGSLLG